MTSDTLFRQKKPKLDDFDFGARTAAVFDDMLDRSIPFYAEMQRMIGQISAEYAQPQSLIFDLGCSTGTTLLTIDRSVSAAVRLVGIDSSPDMLDRASAKFAREGMSHPHELRCIDLEQEVPVRNASVVVMAWTLQFVRPIHRDRVIREISEGLEPNGCFILLEKVSSQASAINRFFIENHLEFKRQRGYSELEIAQKREALENVLIPYREHENQDLLLRNGFRACEVFFRWYNFCGILALK